ncbi:MAG: hypothetical protein HC914_18205 [Chloroflexaceae bacterium]|nr:hypothetical protein [Chloroflexaceae bacterium]
MRTQFNAAYPNGWLVLSFTRCGEELVRLAFDDAMVVLDSIPCDAALLHLIEQASLPAWSEYTYRDLARLGDPTRPPWATLQQLTASLLPAAVVTRLHPERRLLLVPGEPLHNLPWAALRLGDAWLCERAVPHLLPALALSPP